MIFFCENNYHSVQCRWRVNQLGKLPVGVRLRVQRSRSTASTCWTCTQATTAAVARARSGGGPTFIEAPVYRFRAHGGSGDDNRTRYRDEAEREAWERSIVKLFGDYLTRNGRLSDTDVATMERRFARKCRRLRVRTGEPPVEADLCSTSMQTKPSSLGLGPWAVLMWSALLRPWIVTAIR